MSPDGTWTESTIRRTRGRTSPFDPDWLLQRHLVRDVTRALSGVRGRLLDIGCGGRPYESAVAPGVRYVGVDAFVTSAASPDVWASAVQLPFRDAAFDAVVCTQVLEHLRDPTGAVREMARVLRPTGTLILSAPQTWCLHEAPHDYFRFTRFGLRQVCRDAGLEPRSIRVEGGFWASAGTAFIMYVGLTLARSASKMRGPARREAGAPLSRAHRRLLWPLRIPMVLFNLACAALDAIPHAGEFAVNHLVVAQRDPGRVRE